MKNFDIRKMIADAGLKHWQIAEAAGISPSTMCVWLRTELTPERKDRLLTALSHLKRREDEQN